jgi:hypothetical protein
LARAMMVEGIIFTVSFIVPLFFNPKSVDLFYLFSLLGLGTVVILYGYINVQRSNQPS